MQKDIEEIKESEMINDHYTIKCVLITGNIRSCIVEKNIVDSLNKKIAKWL